MKRRDPVPPRLDNVRHPYKRAEMCDGTLVTLRLLSPYAFAEIAPAFNAKALGALAAMKTSRAGVTGLGGLDPESVCIAGLLIGRSWRDEVLELETPEPPQWNEQSMRDYGRAVTEELHDFGFGIADQLFLSAMVVKDLAHSMGIERKVRERRDFSSPSEDTPPSGGPTSSDGPTSPQPADSTH